MRQMDMRSSWTASSAAAIGVLVAGCTAASAQTSTIDHSIRGSALSIYSCRAQPLGHDVTAVPTQVTQFRLCAQQVPNSSSRTVTVRRGDPDFGRLRRTLSAPDEPKTDGVCPMYADVEQRVLARTTTENLLVHIPVDGCGHYQSAALAAINAARADNANPQS